MRLHRARRPALLRRGLRGPMTQIQGTSWRVITAAARCPEFESLDYAPPAAAGAAAAACSTGGWTAAALCLDSRPTSQKVAPGWWRPLDPPTADAQLSN